MKQASTQHMCNSLRQRLDVDVVVDAIVGEQKKDLIDGRMQYCNLPKEKLG